MAIRMIDETSEPTPQEGHRRKRRRVMTRDQRVERQIIDSQHFKDPAKYQEWLNTPAYNKRGPLNQKQDEWLWGFTGADCFGKVDWAKCAHLYFQLFNEKRTAQRLQMEWFRISRNKKNASEHVVAAQEKRISPSYQGAVAPKPRRSSRNAKTQSVAVSIIRSPKDKATATSVADLTHRKTTKRKLEKSDDEQHLFDRRDSDHQSEENSLGLEAAEYDCQEPLPVLMKPVEMFEIGDIISCTAGTKATKPLASLVPNQDQSSHNNTRLSPKMQGRSGRCLAHDRSRGGCSSAATGESSGHEENQNSEQASDIYTGTVVATRHPSAASIRVTSSTAETASNEGCDFFGGQHIVMRSWSEGYAPHGLREREIKQVELAVDMFHSRQHNPHISTTTQITNHNSSWAGEETDTSKTTTSAQKLTLGPADSAKEVIVGCEATERPKDVLELESNVGLVLDPELIGVPPLPKGLLDHTKADAHSQVLQQVPRENYLKGHLPTQNLVVGINLANPSQPHSSQSAFEKSLKRILQTLLDTPPNQDIVIATESDYMIWSVTTSYPAQQVSSKPESKSNSTSTRELIERVRAIIKGREMAGSKTEFE